MDAAHEARTHLIEAIADYDDELMEAYLDEEAIDVARLKAAIRKATLDISMTPVLCGSSFKNKGVQPLLDAVIDYLPSPLDVPPVEGLEPGQRRGRGQRRATREPPTTSPSRRSPSRSCPTRSSASSPTSASTPASSARAAAC